MNVENNWYRITFETYEEGEEFWNWADEMEVLQDFGWNGIDLEGEASMIYIHWEVRKSEAFFKLTWL